MISTRVGYAGGTKRNPTYRSLGDHTESLQIEYDPARISFAELVKIFWSMHEPCSRPWTAQYKAILFYGDESQRLIAERTKSELEAELGRKVFTEVRPIDEFYQAEDYHQKYRLQQDPELMAELRLLFPEFQQFVDSTLAARLNGFLAGNGSIVTLQQEIDSYGLSGRNQQRLLALFAPGRGAALRDACPVGH